MNKGASYYRARTEAIRFLLDDLENHPELAEGKNSPRELLKNGYVSPLIEDKFKTKLNEAWERGSSAPLDFRELTSYSTWFDMHPEKIAGTETVTTSFHFPIKITGTKEDIIRTIRGTSSQSERTPSEQPVASGIALKLKLKAKALKTKLLLAQ